MTRFGVSITTTASIYVEVEADSAEEAEEKAWDEAEFPYFPGGMSGDLGDWQTADVDELT